MRLFNTPPKLSSALWSLLLVAVCATGVWAQGNACEENPNPGNGGCGINPQVIQHQTVSGGIDFAGTEYDNTCAKGEGGCSVNQPLMRFWEYDNFDVANSAVHPQSVDPTYWMVNPTLDFPPGSDPSRWIFFQSNWANAQVQGCPTSGRTVAEVSFCDTVTSEAYYVVGSVTGPAYDFDDITGADTGPGGEDNLMPLTQVPIPTNLPINCSSCWDNPGPGWGTVTLDLTSPLGWYTENGFQDPANPLIAGFEILFLSDTAQPTGCQSGLGPFSPVLDPADPGSDPANPSTWNYLGVVNPGTGITVTVPTPASVTIPTWFSVRVVYADDSTGCLPGDCNDPQGSGTPASCFMSSARHNWVIPVTFVYFDAKRVAGDTVRITWMTAEEIDTYGFKVLRAPAGSADYTQIGPVVLARGAYYSYSVTDTTALRSLSYDYQVQEVAFSGVPTVAGPVRVGASADTHRKRHRLIPGGRR